MNRSTLLLSFFLLFSNVAPTIAHAEPDEANSEAPTEKVHVMLGPVVSYQSLQRDYPYSHRQGMLTYGGRLVVGTYRLAGEFEMQYGSATENFPDSGVSTNTTLTQGRLGVRVIRPLIEEIHLIMRAGMQAYRFSNDVSVNSVTVSNSPAWSYRPYLGTGVILYFFKALSLSVEEVYVVGSSFETSFGFRLFI